MSVTKLNVSQQKANVGRCGTVKIYPPAVEGGIGVVVTPVGNIVNTASSVTSGLQEGIDYAYNNGCNLYIVGGNEPIALASTAGPTSGAVVYQCGTTVQFRPMQGGWIFAEPCTFNWGYSANYTAMQFDTMLMADINMKGCQLVNGGSGVTLKFKPTNPAPSDTLFGVGMQGVFECFSVVNINTNTAAVASVPLIEMDASGGPITYSRFSIDEPNASGIALRVLDPVGSSAFHDNKTYCGFIHGQTGGSNNIVQVGTSTAANTKITNNVWDLFINSSVNTGKGVSTYERTGLYRSLGVVSGVQSYGLFFESGAQGNTAIYTQLSGTNTLASNVNVSAGGALDKNRIIGMNNTGTIQFTITPSGSPYSYQNMTGSELMIILNQTGGGTISDIAIGSLSVNTLSVGSTAGCYMLKPGAYIKVTYTGTITMAGIF